MNKKFWLASILVFCLQLLAIAILTPMGWALKAIETEQSYFQDHLGIEGSQELMRTANEWHKAVIIDSGAYAGTVNMLIPTSKQKEQSRGIEKMGTAEGWFAWVKSRIDVVSEVTRHMMMRVALLVTWMPYILIFFVPAVYDGYMTWKIKRTNFKYVSPVVSRYMMGGISILCAVIVILFFAPIAIPPLYIPASLLLFSLMLSKVISNIQKRI